MSQTVTILIVENNFIMQQFLVNYLKDEFVVFASDNVEEAIGILESDNSKIEAILTDINMTSGLDGYDLIRYVKKNTFIPTMVVSSNEQSSDRVHAFKLGADDYIVKPFNPEELKIRLHKLLRQPVMS
jgi:DNA-binding response OmpR family regulator